MLFLMIHMLVRRIYKDVHAFRNGFYTVPNDLHAFPNAFQAFLNDLHAFPNDLHVFPNDLHAFPIYIFPAQHLHFARSLGASISFPLFYSL